MAITGYTESKEVTSSNSNTQLKEFTKYEKLGESFSRILDSVSVEMDILKKNAPKDLYDRIKEFEGFLENYDLEALRPKSIETTGEFFDLSIIEVAITKQTGYIWKVRDLSKKKSELEDRGITKEDIEERYNISPTEIKVYEFNRDSYSRDELYMIELILMPGHAILNLSTRRVSFSSDILNSTKEMLKYIKDL